MRWLTTIAITIFGLIFQTASAHADPPSGTTIVCNEAGCHVVVAGPGSGAGGSSESGTQDADFCAGLPDPNPIFGNCNPADGCYYRLDSAQPPATDPVWGGHTSAEGAIYLRSCVATGVYDSVFRSIAPTVTPAQLAQRAFASLALPHPTPGRSPAGVLSDGRTYTFVRVPTWFWTDPASYKRLSARADVGGVWAQVTVIPSVLTFDPGDGGIPVSCAGPGEPWQAGRDGQWAPAPGGCDYAYPRSTVGFADGQLTATYAITWTVSWLGSGGTDGTLPSITTVSKSTFAVAEAQAVIVR
jgi:hypothetical protein